MVENTVSFLIACVHRPARRQDPAGVRLGQGVPAVVDLVPDGLTALLDVLPVGTETGGVA